MPLESPTGMDEPSKSNRRAYYRLRYPMADRPTIRCEDQNHEVAEISERGARIVLVGSVVRRDQPFAGVLRFPDGETIFVDGVVLRSDQKETILQLSTGVSLQRMVAEQIRLREKYPVLYDSTEGGSDTEPA